MICTDQASQFGTHVIHGLVAKFNHHRLMHVFPSLASLNIQVIEKISSARKGERELDTVLMHVSESAQTQN